MIQVKSMNVITSFTSLSTNTVRLITIQVLCSYLQAQLVIDKQSYRLVRLQCKNVIYLGVFRFTSMRIVTRYITYLSNLYVCLTVNLSNCLSDFSSICLST